MKTIVHKANTRGFFDHGWLRTFHTFSFADYYDPQRVNFGALRVLNDDSVDPGMGFGMHPHRDMEVVSLPLHGTLEHQDSLGHRYQIKEGEIQVMSAGTGIRHSEYNASEQDTAEFLQIWVIPDEVGLKPRYENASLKDLLKPNEFSTIVSPYSGSPSGMWIHQKAWFSLGMLEYDVRRKYELKSGGSLGVYVFVIDGKIEAAGQTLERRDGMGVFDTDSFEVHAVTNSTVLLIEVPDI